MKDLFNKDNFTSLAIVILGVILASVIAPIIQGFIPKKKSTAA